uniref:Uncharacterized protein n=1 Tax=uncultured organism TaxID=155900 RepID=M1QAV2_9ZZZZ|nr:hypothetical protein FLSS-17_0011 [uncultured organism]
MSDRNGRLVHGGSRGSSRVTLVRYPVGSTAVKAGDFVWVESADTGSLCKATPGDGTTYPLFGVMKEDADANGSGLVEIPFGAVYEVPLCITDFWEMDPRQGSMVHMKDQKLTRKTSGGELAGQIISEDPSTGERAKVILWGGAIQGLGSPFGTIPGF